LLAEVVGLALKFSQSSATMPPDTRVSNGFAPVIPTILIRVVKQVVVEHAGLTLHLCADTLTALTAFVSDWTATLGPPVSEQ
jgi:hypothetical protein